MQQDPKTVVGNDVAVQVDNEVGVEVVELVQEVDAVQEDNEDGVEVVELVQAVLAELSRTMPAVRSARIDLLDSPRCRVTAERPPGLPPGNDLRPAT